MRMKAAKSLTDFRNKDGRSELMFRYIYDNESNKVINLNSFGCGLNKQKNAPSKERAKNNLRKGLYSFCRINIWISNNSMLSSCYS